VKLSRKTVRPIAGELLYIDSSALVKLILDERERTALESYLKNRPRLVTSRLATVEVARAVKVANASARARAEAAALIERCLLIDVDEPILGRAVELTSVELRALDAVHLATAEHVEPDQVIAYDRRLLQAADRAGFPTSSPGT